MKKSAYIFAASLALATVLSCNRAIEPEEAVTPQPAAETLTFRAVLEQPDTKASLNSDYAVVWEAGDQIAVYNGTEWVSSEPLTDSAIENNGRYATFSVNIAEGDTYYAVYPASAAPSAAVSEDVLAVTLPDVQVIPSGGCVAKDALVQVCKTSDKDNMVFKNISSLVEFKAPEALDGYVRFEAFDAEGTALQVAGVASVNAAAPAAVSGNAGKVIVKGSFAAGQNYFAVVYPQSGVSSFRFAFSKEDADNGTLKAFKTGSSAIDLPLNGGKKFSDLGTLKWLGPLSTKADLDKWAKYADYYLAGETVKLGADINYEGGTWTPVNGNDATGFAGCLDGQGHSIYNIIINTTITENCGFFSSITSSSSREDILRVKDLLLGANPLTKKWDETSHITAETEGKASKIGALSGTTTRSSLMNIDNYIAITAKQSQEVHVGGITGRTGNDCSLDNCSNHAIIDLAIDYTTVYAGGIVGTIGGDNSKFDLCYNYGSVIRSKASSNFGNTFIGGIIGRCGGNTQNTMVTDCHNDGCVGTTVDILANQVFIGGILGMDHSSGDESVPNITLSNCSNAINGAVQFFTFSNSSANDTGIGGIVGTIKNKTIVSNCTNYGRIKKLGDVSCSQGKYGGIVGSLMSANGTIQSCENAESGVVEDLEQITTKKIQRVGGIVGLLNQGTLDSCVNKGIVRTNSTKNSAAIYEYVGGVVGNYTAGTITNCVNIGTVSVSGTTGRFAAGGIVGLINGKSTSTGANCEVSGAISCGYAGNAGLIVGMYSQHSTTFGTETQPVKVHSGITVNGSAVDSGTYKRLLAGTDAGFSDSGVQSTGGDTIWATFVNE